MFRHLFVSVFCCSLLINAAAAQAQTPRPAETLVIELATGKVTVRLRPDLAPRHVERIATLAREGFYDGLKFHRVIRGFMAQTGDPKGNGTGKSKYPDLRAEFSSELFRYGTVGMARSGNPDSANSQFFICSNTNGCSNLTGQFTIVGDVTGGMALVERLATGEPPARPDIMRKVTVAASSAVAAQLSPPAAPIETAADREIAARIAAFRADPTDHIKCTMLEIAYLSQPFDGRPRRSLEREHPDIFRACAEAKAANEAAAAKRKREWQPDYDSWLRLSFAAGLVGALVGLLSAAVTGVRSARAFVAPALSAAAASALLYGVLHVDFITQSATAIGSFRFDYIDLPLSDYLKEISLLSLNWPLFGSPSVREVILGFAGGFIGLATLAVGRSAAITVPATAELPSRQETFVRRAFPFAVVGGLAVLAYGIGFAPRTYRGLGWEGYLAIPVGLAMVVGFPFLVWWRTASWPALAIGTAMAAASVAGLMHVAGRSNEAIPLGWALALATYLLARETSRKWRLSQRGLLQASRFAFTWPFTSTAAIEARAKALPAEALVAAYHLPEHTAHARDAINRELVVRGEPRRQADSGWLPDGKRATLGPAFARNIAASTYARYVRNRRRLTIVVRGLGLVGVITVIGIVAIAPLLSLIIIVGGFFGRKRAARILLLRPFGQPQMTAALKTVVRTHLGTLGHVYTLSDRNYRPNFVLAVITRVFDIATLLLGPILRPSFRIASVKDERSFFAFAAALVRTWKPSAFSLLSAGQAFNIRTTDDWWKRCIDLLMRSSDLIVMDVSRVSAGSAWEIEQLGGRGLQSDCVFICQSDHLAAAQAAFGDNGPKLFVFDSTGRFAEAEGALESLLSDKVTAAASTWGDRSRTPSAITAA